MADFAPPTGPPPPKVPEGWKAIWNDQYNEWFYVNIYTKQSQWDKPTEPIYPPGGTDQTSDAPPPGYEHGSARPVGLEKQTYQAGGTDPFTGAGAAGASNQLSEDEKLARKLQEEENRQSSGNPSSGAAGSYYSQPGQTMPAPGMQAGELPPRPDDRGSKGKGILGKILGKVGKQPHQQQQYMSQGGQGYYSQPGYAPPGYPPQGYPPQAGYYPPGRPGRRPGGGMGAGGAAALGVGGGLMGGMLLGSALDGGDHGGDYGGDDGGDGGGDFGGGDFGGGDFGGGDF